jgi:hypothetical protein
VGRRRVEDWCCVRGELHIVAGLVAEGDLRSR